MICVYCAADVEKMKVTAIQNVLTAAIELQFQKISNIDGILSLLNCVLMFILFINTYIY